MNHAPLPLARAIANLPCPAWCDRTGNGAPPDDPHGDVPCPTCKGRSSIAYEGEWPQLAYYHRLEDSGWVLLWINHPSRELRARLLPAPVLLGYDGTSGLLPWLCGQYGFKYYTADSWICYIPIQGFLSALHRADTPLALVQAIIDWANAKANREPVQWEAKQ